MQTYQVEVEPYNKSNFTHEFQPLHLFTYSMEGDPSNHTKLKFMRPMLEGPPTCCTASSCGTDKTTKGKEGPGVHMRLLQMH